MIRRSSIFLPMFASLDYDKLPIEEIRKRIELRKDQIAQLRHLHLTTHHTIEKHERKHEFDKQEKMHLFGQAVDKMNFSTVTNQRHDLKAIRMQEEEFGRDYVLLYGVCFVSTMLLWLYLRNRYVKLPGTYKPVPIGDLRRGDGAIYSRLLFKDSPSARGRDTDFEKELRERREKGAT